MKTATSPQRPSFRVNCPTWFHHHGYKMEIIDLEPAGPNRIRSVVIGGSAAHIKIFPHLKTDTCWLLDWEITQNKWENSRGRIILSWQELKAAFDLSELSGDSGDWLIKEYGAESAQQGKYIRWKCFLNIPGPGTGLDGDANVSVFITEAMKEAVRFLQESR